MKMSLGDEQSCLSGYHPLIVRKIYVDSILRALERIKDELQPLSEHTSAAGYQGNEADEHSMSEITEELRDVVIEYQVSPRPPVMRTVLCLGTMQFAQQKSLYEQNCRLIVGP